MKSQLVIVFSIIIVSLCILGCSKPPSNSIIVHIGCSNTEAESDVQHSVSSLNDFFQQNSINIKYMKSDTICAYELKSNGEAKLLRGALTDIELKNECIAFFRLK